MSDQVYLICNAIERTKRYIEAATNMRGRNRLERELSGYKFSFWKRVMESGRMPDFNGGTKTFYLEDYRHLILKEAPSLLK